MDFAANALFPNQADPDAQRRQRRMAGAQAARLPDNPFVGLQGAPAFMGFANAAMAPGMNAHAGAMNQVNQAISGEMQSRVAQAREGRRMQHEKDMLLMRLRGMNGGGAAPQMDDRTAAMMVLQMENAAGRGGTARLRALRKLGL